MRYSYQLQRASIMAERPVEERLLRAKDDAAGASSLRFIWPWSLRTVILTIIFSIVAATTDRSIRRAASVPLSYVDLVAAIMPVPLQVVMCGATVLGGLYALFLRIDGKIGQLAAFGGVARPGRRLIADTGASMHAVGDSELLQDLELFANPKLVKMANGTVEDVLGFGRIEWGPFSIPNVYLVKGLETSLISISQLDREHGMHSCFGQGKGEIMLADGTVVGAAFLDKNDGMYVLRFLEVPDPEPAPE